MGEAFWRQVFQPDCGTLLYIWVYGTTEADYRTLLAMLASRYEAKYLRDDVEQNAMPDYRVIDEDNNLVSVRVRFFAHGVLVHVWFGDDERMDLDVLPDEVDSPEKAQAIFHLMKELSSVLNKRVLLTAENVSATQEWSEQYAICSINPPDDRVRYHGS